MYGNGYAYRKKLTINTALSSVYNGNIAVPLDLTDADFKSVANGGKVRLNPLLDIRFEDGVQYKIPHEIISYDAVNGRVVAWLKFSVLDPTGYIYIYFGKDLAPVTVDSTAYPYWSGSGITLGFGSSNLTAMKNSNAIAYGYNLGELYTYCSQMTDAYGNNLSLGDTSGENSGQESGSPYYGYLMYHTAATGGRFTMASGGKRANFALVTQTGSQWQYDNNTALVNFTPNSSDILVARIKWGGSAGFEVLQPLRAGEENLLELWNRDSYRGVWHFEDIPDATTSWKEHRDAGWYSNTGDSGGSMNSSDSVDSVVGKGLDFDGTNDSITIVGDNSQTNLQILGDLTMSIWVYPRSSGQRRNIVGKAYGGEYELTLETNNTVSYYWGRSGANSGTSGATNGYQGFSSTVPLTLNAWNHVVVSRKVGTGGWVRMYINGVLDNSVAPLYTSAVASALNITLGTGRLSGAAQWFNGILDEFKLQPIARDTDWVEYEYETQKNLGTFWVLGSTQYALQTLTHTEDTLLRKQVPLVDTIDALLRKNVALTHYIDSFLRKRYNIDTTTDAVLRARLFTTHSVDSLLKPPLGSAVTHNVDALLKYRFTRTHSIDASVSLRFAPTTKTDTLLRRRTEAQNTVNALLRKNVAITNAIDALLKGTISKEQAIDTLLRYRYQTQQAIDTLLSKRVLLSTTFDAMFHTANYAIQTVDAYLLCRKPFTDYDDFTKPPTSFDGEIMIATTYEGESKPKTAYSMDSKTKTHYNNEQKPKTAYKGC